MKKVIFSVTLVLLTCMVSMISCKKVYQCSCSFNNQIVYTQDLGSQTLKDAKNQCGTHDSTITGEVWNCTVY
jgi:hypothetical protein